MSDWAYLAIAYTIVWGALALYALLLARRVYQAGLVERQLQAAVSTSSSPGEQHPVCDDPPAP